MEPNELIAAWESRAVNLAYHPEHCGGATAYRTAAHELRTALAAPPVEQADDWLEQERESRGMEPAPQAGAAKFVWLTPSEAQRAIKEGTKVYAAQPAPRAGAAELARPDAELWAVIKEMEASHDPVAREWAGRLELTNVALLADIYDQCCDAIAPLVNARQLPGSVVESVQMLVQQFAAQAPSQPGRAVMQQALNALQTLHSMQSEWHAAFPEHVGDKEAPAMQAARAAIAALSATMEAKWHLKE